MGRVRAKPAANDPRFRSPRIADAGYTLVEASVPDPMVPMKLFPVLFLLSAAACLSAQGAPLYSPPDLASREGRSMSFHPGAFAIARYQFLDGDHIGKTGTLKEIAFRLNDEAYTVSTGMGHRWSNVTIDLADGDFLKFDRTLQTNLLSTPTLVFSSTVAWPTVAGKPTSRPAQWGGATAAYRFPFKTGWLYSGTKDLVSDWVFTGGTLANNTNFTSQVPYRFDSWLVDINRGVSATSSALPAQALNNNSPGVTGRCNDSAWGSTVNGSYVDSRGTVYEPYYTSAAWRNKVVLQSASYYTAPSAPVIHAWGITAHTTGVDIGTGCYKLHLPQVLFMQTMMTLPKNLSSSGLGGWAPYLVFDWVPAVMSGLKVYTQGAWADTATGRLNVTRANILTLPSVQFLSKPPRRASAFSSPTRPGGLSYHPFENPVMRYLR